MNSALHILHIYRLDFHLKKKILPSIFEKILWSNKSFKALNLDLTTFPFLHFGIL
jgi:hypothetical protein